MDVPLLPPIPHISLTNPPPPQTQLVIEMVLGTDMKSHFSIISHFSTIHRLGAGGASMLSTVHSGAPASSTGTTGTGGGGASGMRQIGHRGSRRGSACSGSSINSFDPQVGVQESAVVPEASPTLIVLMSGS